MADTNTYTSKQNVKKYTTQAKFDAIDKSDVPVGTEYNIVGEIEEADLSAELQAKVNLTGDNLTTEVTGGKVKVKNPMTSACGGGFKLNSFYNETTGVTYFFPIETPIGHFATGIVPILGSVTGTKPGSTSPATYQGVFLPNAYSENNYGRNAYGMLTMSESHNSGNQIYILPYCSSNPGVSHLLSEYSITAGPGIAIRDTTSGQSTPVLEISCSGSGSPSIGSKTYADFVVGAHPDILPVWGEPEDGTVYAAAQPAADGGSGYTRFVLLAPTGANSRTLSIPDKSGTLATLDDILTGGSGIAITLSGASGTLTDEQFTNLYSNDNCYIKHSGNILRLMLHANNLGVFVSVAGTLLQYVTVNDNTKEWTFKSASLTTTDSFKTINGTSIVGEGDIAITGGGSITATELNETPSSLTTITLAELKALDTGFYNASNCILKGDTDLPHGYYHLIKIKAANGTDGSLIAQDHDNGSTYVLTFRLSGTAIVGWSELVRTENLPTFKTLFGDQSIEGEGNIDLYKHIVTITGEADSQGIGDTVSVEGYIIFYSSKNLDCNSLTDLKTVLGDTFIEKAFGYVTRPTTGDIWAIDYVTETYVYFSGTTSSGQNGKATVPFVMEMVDEITTI